MECIRVSDENGESHFFSRDGKESRAFVSATALDLQCA